MANNAVTRAILKRRPAQPAPPPPPQESPMSAEDQKVEKIVSPYETQRKQQMEQRFSGLEQKLFGQELGRAQRESDILERRFAALGGQPGKEAMEKAFSLAGKEAGRRLDIGQSEIEQERLGQEAALGQEMAQMRMQTGERIRGQEFQKAEREAAQEFQAKEAELNRELQQQQIDLAAKELDLNTKISLENLAQNYGGKVPLEILDRLKESGMSEDVLKYFYKDYPSMDANGQAIAGPTIKIKPIDLGIDLSRAHRAGLSAAQGR